MARPSSYAPETGAKICVQLSQGKSLVKICKAKDMPDQATVYRWLAGNPEFREMYTRAREDQADTLFDETLAIADALPSNASAAAVRRAALKIDTRKWAAGKLRPRKYGDRQTVTVGEDPDNPFNKADAVKNIPTDALEAKVASSLAKNRPN